MIEEENFGDSDSDDTDFKISSENLTNESSISESESTTSEPNELPTSSVTPKIKMKRIQKNKKSSKKTRLQVPHIEENANKDIIEVTPEKEKERTDLLWNNFLKCAGTQSKNSENNSHKSGENSEMLKETMPKQDSNLESNKDHESKFIKANRFKQIKTNVFNSGTKSKIFAQQPNDLKRRGLSNILSRISKKSKINTLEKSKQDWNQFKEEQNLNEEITNFNRGKNGYLERQDFLQRTDSRQFEIEKELRNSGKRKTK